MKKQKNKMVKNQRNRTKDGKNKRLETKKGSKTTKLSRSEKLTERKLFKRTKKEDFWRTWRRRIKLRRRKSIKNEIKNKRDKDKTDQEK